MHNQKDRATPITRLTVKQYELELQQMNKEYEEMKTLLTKAVKGGINKKSEPHYREARATLMMQEVALKGMLKPDEIRSISPEERANYLNSIQKHIYRPITDENVGKTGDYQRIVSVAINEIHANNNATDKLVPADSIPVHVTKSAMLDQYQQMIKSIDDNIKTLTDIQKNPSFPEDKIDEINYNIKRFQNEKTGMESRQKQYQKGLGSSLLEQLEPRNNKRISNQLQNSRDKFQNILGGKVDKGSDGKDDKTFVAKLDDLQKRLADVKKTIPTKDGGLPKKDQTTIEAFTSKAGEIEVDIDNNKKKTNLTKRYENNVLNNLSDAITDLDDEISNFNKRTKAKEGEVEFTSSVTDLKGEFERVKIAHEAIVSLRATESAELKTKGKIEGDNTKWNKDSQKLMTYVNAEIKKCDQYLGAGGYDTERAKDNVNALMANLKTSQDEQKRLSGIGLNSVDAPKVSVPTTDPAEMKQIRDNFGFKMVDVGSNIVKLQKLREDLITLNSEFQDFKSRMQPSKTFDAAQVAAWTEGVNNNLKAVDKTIEDLKGYEKSIKGAFDEFVKGGMSVDKMNAIKVDLAEGGKFDMKPYNEQYTKEYKDYRTSRSSMPQGTWKTIDPIDTTTIKKTTRPSPPLTSASAPAAAPTVEKKQPEFDRAGFQEILDGYRQIQADHIQLRAEVEADVGKDRPQDNNWWRVSDKVLGENELKKTGPIELYEGCVRNIELLENWIKEPDKHIKITPDLLVSWKDDMLKVQALHSDLASQRPRKDIVVTPKPIITPPKTIDDHKKTASLTTAKKKFDLADLKRYYGELKDGTVTMINYHKTRKAKDPDAKWIGGDRWDAESDHFKKDMESKLKIIDDLITRQDNPTQADIDKVDEYYDKDVKRDGDKFDQIRKMPKKEPIEIKIDSISAKPASLLTTGSISGTPMGVEPVTDPAGKVSAVGEWIITHQDSITGEVNQHDKIDVSKPQNQKLEHVAAAIPTINAKAVKMREDADLNGSTVNFFEVADLVQKVDNTTGRVDQNFNIKQPGATVYADMPNGMRIGFQDHANGTLTTFIEDGKGKRVDLDKDPKAFGELYAKPGPTGAKNTLNVTAQDKTGGVVVVNAQGELYKGKQSAEGLVLENKVDEQYVMDTLKNHTTTPSKTSYAPPPSPASSSPGSSSGEPILTKLKVAATDTSATPRSSAYAAAALKSVATSKPIDAEAESTTSKHRDDLESSRMKSASEADKGVKKRG